MVGWLANESLSWVVVFHFAFLFSDRIKSLHNQFVYRILKIASCSVDDGDFVCLSVCLYCTVLSVCAKVGLRPTIHVRSRTVF